MPKLWLEATPRAKSYHVRMVSFRRARSSIGAWSANTVNIRNDPSNRSRYQALIAPRVATKELAAEWYDTQPVPGYGELTAQQLVQQGQGKEIAKFLTAVDMGIFA